MATGTYTTHFSHHIYTSVLRFDVYIILCTLYCVCLCVYLSGQHPLRNYPGRYLNEGKVKYRSHNYQSLPDVNKVRIVCVIVLKILT